MLRLPKALSFLANGMLDLVRPLLREHKVGRHTVRLPKGSQLKNYQHHSRRYDFALGPISATIAAKYPEFSAIDVGANVGDTAAIICREQDIPVLCIEGDKAVLPLLHLNARRIGPHIVVEEAFIGAEGDTVDVAGATSIGLNATLRPALNGIQLRTLTEIVEQHPRFRSAKLLKIDTEGYDFKIIEGAQRFLTKAKPVVFFEYDPSFYAPDLRAGIATVRILVDLGYTRFIVYDNRGNFMLSLSDENVAERFLDLNAFLASHRRFGTAVHYLDVCAFHAEDADLHEMVHAGELAAVLDTNQGRQAVRWTPPHAVLSPA